MAKSNSKKAESDIFAQVRARHSAWANVKKADGEYRDFTKYDFDNLEMRGLGEVSLQLPNSKMPNGVVVAPLSSIVGPSFSLASQHLMRRGIDLSSDKLLSWHGAHVQDGFFIHVAAGVQAPPLTLRTQANGSSAVHHLIMLEKGARAEIILHAAGRRDALRDSVDLHSDLSEAILEEESQLILTTVQDYPTSDWAFSHHYHHLSKFAKLTHTAASLGAAVSRTRALNHLDGARSRADSYQIFLGQGEQFMDLESHSAHHVPDTEGLMTCKGAMDGSSVGVYKGQILIDRAATNTVSHQSGAALLLSEHSKANIIPSLQVHNDQVEAGHGATVGSLDGREMLYLRSRGLAEADAQLLALTGYFNELISKIPGAASRTHLRQLTDQYIASLPIHRQASPTAVEHVSIPGNEARATVHQA